MRLALLALLVAFAPVVAADPPTAVPLFNGNDLTGWVNVNGAPGTWTVKDGEVVTTGFPIGFLRTEKQYENFELEMEWMHVNTKAVGNSGLFVWADAVPQVGGPFTRGIEVQVLVNYPKNDWATNHGDVFSVSGAKCVPDRPHPTRKGLERCLPSENRAKGGGEWNHYKIIAKDGAIKLHVNGKEVSGVSECNPRKGYLALESEGAECHFRNLKITELPSSDPKPEVVATADVGFRMIGDATTLAGWTTEKDSWTVAGGNFQSKGKAGLTTAKKYKNFELFFDRNGPAGDGVVRSGDTALTATPKDGKPGQWVRHTVRVTDATEAKPLTFEAADKLQLRNIFIRELTEDKK
jgi:hypothetical protein